MPGFDEVSSGRLTGTRPKPILVVVHPVSENNVAFRSEDLGVDAREVCSEFKNWLQINNLDFGAGG